VNLEWWEWMYISCETVNVWWMLYIMYAILGVDSCSEHGDIQRDDVTWFTLLMVESRIRNRQGGTSCDWDGGYVWMWDIWSTTYLIGFRIPAVSICTCRIIKGIGKYPQNSLKSLFLVIISLFTSHLALSCAQLYHQLRSWNWMFAHAMIMT